MYNRRLSQNENGLVLTLKAVDGVGENWYVIHALNRRNVGQAEPKKSTEPNERQRAPNRETEYGALTFWGVLPW